MMKRISALLIALILLIGCTVSEAEVETAAQARQIEMKTFPFYLDSLDDTWPEAFPLYFVDGVYDLPFVELSDWAGFLNWFFPTKGERLYDGYHVDVDADPDGHVLTYMRENSHNVLFDFDAGEIVWDDYVGFQQQTVGAYMDIAGIPATDEEGRPYLLSSLGGRNRFGGVTTLNLAERNIPMISQDGKFLVPLQTLSAFFLSSAQTAIFFNQKVLIMCAPSEMIDPSMDLARSLNHSGLMTDEIIEALQSFEGGVEEKVELLMQKISETEEGRAFLQSYQETRAKSLYPLYVDSPKGARSQALIEYGTRELCLELDCIYGLKESHHISDFSTFFLQTGLTASLLEPDAVKADSAIAELTQFRLDDLHSGFIGASYLSESNPMNNSGRGFSELSFSELSEKLSVYRAINSETEQGYFEVGNTAYVTFDEFVIEMQGDTLPDYYALAESDALPDDTIGLIAQAHRQITRENSPIENVVLDLSCNDGGMAPAALYVLGWFLGNAQVSVQDPFTGAESTNVYRADVNLDHQFDEDDTISDLNLFCLISPASFSCANLVPWAFKEDGRVTLLGKVSGGGSCVVQPMTTAWGTAFQISGHTRISFVKNGSYYDVDRGVEPDYIISNYNHFYDREALTNFINGLY